MAVLQVLQGDIPKAAYVLKPRSYTLGRAPENDVSLPDRSVSRHHARIGYAQDGFYIEDQTSRHGVFVDSAKVKRTVLASGRLIRLGSVVLKFVRLDPDGSTAEGLTIPEERLRAQGPAGAGEGAIEALDQLQIGVVLVAADGSVVLANRSARGILDEGDGLTLGPGGLRAEDSATMSELRRLIRDSPRDGGSPRGGALAVPRATRRPLTLLITPLGAEGSRIEKPQAVKAVFITDPERGIESGEESLRRLYGLTPAETRVANELLQGKSMEEAAGELAITLNTARGHLRSVFSKTDTRRQSELVRLLLGGAAQVRPG